MPERVTAAEAAYLAMVARLPCAACKRLGLLTMLGHVHHVAIGSGIRSHYSVVKLCLEHHDVERRGSGFHGMGTEKFCKVFGVPGEREEGLIVWTAEDVCEFLRRELRARSLPLERLVAV